MEAILEIDHSLTEGEQLLLINQGLGLLLEKVQKEKTIVTIHKQLNPDNEHLITYYEQTSYRILALKKSIDTRLTEMINKSYEPTE